MVCCALMATTLLAASAATAQTGDAAQPLRVASPEKEAKKEKEKAKVLGLLDQAEALGRWTPNERSFLSVLDAVRGRVAGARESEFEGLRPYDPHLTHLESSLARIAGRMGALQTAVELCDPARKEDLFLLFLDVLDVEGQTDLNSRICEKVAAREEATDGLADTCTATNLAFLAAKSVSDLVVTCDPSLAHKGSDVSAGRFDKLSAEIAGAQTGMQESVRSAKRELTQAMTVVADHVAEVQSVHSSKLEATMMEGSDLNLRMEIERTLQQNQPYGWAYLPQANGGKLELVRAVVDETIQNVAASGESINGAAAKLSAANDAYSRGQFKAAFRLYSEAYRAAIGTAPAKK